jgi:hypothetical protein
MPKILKIEKTPNELLRGHLTRVGFDLSLGRTHIAALVYLDQSIRQNKQWHLAGYKISRSMGRAFAHFATATSGLIERGLVVHHWDEKANKLGKGGLKPHYTITKAGQLVIGLLQESGLYEEYAVVLREAS